MKVGDQYWSIVNRGHTLIVLEITDKFVVYNCDTCVYHNGLAVCEKKRFTKKIKGK